eukprot:1091841-Pyramimonas_sp.AAC.1
MRISQREHTRTSRDTRSFPDAVPRAHKSKRGAVQGRTWAQQGASSGFTTLAWRRGTRPHPSA